MINDIGVKNILVLNEYYLPGYKAGGPIRSISNLVSWLGHEFKFKIITTDRDSFEEQSYKNIEVNEWNQVENADVYYMNKSNIGFEHWYNLLKYTKYDAVYLNSVFNLWFSIIPLLILVFLLRVNPSRILLSPRGELSKGALDQKAFKKKVFLWFLKLVGVHKKIFWQATNQEEKKEIFKKIKVPKNNIYVASNLPQKFSVKEFKKVEKEVDSLKIIYLSRITPKKNLDFSLQILENLKELNISFDIFGSISDEKFWKKCKIMMSGLPDNIHVSYKGVIDHKRVIPTISNYHLFFLPTKGENFGHAIYEAMLAGTPVLVSDQTPWLQLEQKKLGWSVPLVKRSRFIEIIKNLAKMNQVEINKQKITVREKIIELDIIETVKKSRDIFISLI